MPTRQSPKQLLSTRATTIGVMIGLTIETGIPNVTAAITDVSVTSVPISTIHRRRDNRPSSNSGDFFTILPPAQLPLPRFSALRPDCIWSSAVHTDRGLLASGKARRPYSTDSRADATIPSARLARLARRLRNVVGGGADLPEAAALPLPRPPARVRTCVCGVVVNVGRGCDAHTTRRMRLLGCATARPQARMESAVLAVSRYVHCLVSCTALAITFWRGHVQMFGRLARERGRWR